MSSAAQYAPDSVHSAKQALERAEAVHADDPQSREEQSFAYVAQRRAELAIANGNIAAARKQQADATNRYSSMQNNLRESAQQRANSLNEELKDQRVQSSAQLNATTRELQQERVARQAAEERAQRALQSLEEVAKVKEESRGTVITLSGQVLFVTGKAELLPAARDQLTRVAKALLDQGVDKTIVIEGHTDSRGSDADNLRLSQARAETVRTYLISQGVPADKVAALGKGEAQPVASNDTTEGRANNRRVEIVIGNSAQPSSGQPGSTQPSQGQTR
jgi:outer membrane protein OmpA-like peptidoglycan-associated protein